MLGPGFALIPAINSKISINSHFGVHIYCISMSLFDVNCPSLKRDKFTGLT